MFLSADPQIQEPTYSQNYNRYSYVLNNPLRYTDPSGFNFLEKISSGLATFISIVISIYCAAPCAVVFNMAYADANGATWGGTLTAAAIGFIGSGMGAAVGGSAWVQGAVAGAFNAYITGGNIFRGAMRGALYSAAMAYIVHNIQEANKPMQPEIAERPEVPIDPQGANPSGTGQEVGQVVEAEGAPAPSDNQGGAKVNFNYKTDGLEKFALANKEFGVDKLFEGVLPDGTHDINVSIDTSIDSFMRTPNASTILVNPNALSSSSLNVIGSAIGHELVHINDHLRGNLNVSSSASVRASEVRAYGWQFKNARHFGLSLEYKSWLTNQIRDHR